MLRALQQGAVSPGTAWPCALHCSSLQGVDTPNPVHATCRRQASESSKGEDEDKDEDKDDREPQANSDSDADPLPWKYKPSAEYYLPLILVAIFFFCANLSKDDRKMYDEITIATWVTTGFILIPSVASNRRAFFT